MTNNQLDLFKMLNDGAEVEKAKKVEKNKPSSSTNEKNEKKVQKVTPTVKPREELGDKINLETIISYPLYDDIPITDLFTNEEIEFGIGSKNDKGEIVINKITEKDIVEKYVELRPVFSMEYTKLGYASSTNKLHVMIAAGTKGMLECPNRTTANNFLPNQKKIPIHLLIDFIVEARKIAYKYRTEIHAEIFYSKNQEYFLYFPNQKAHRSWVKPENNLDLQYENHKVMEIHSHHFMENTPSDTDNISERGPILYAIIGKIDNILPNLIVRCFDGYQHIELNSIDIFDNFIQSDIYDYKLEVSKQ